MKSPVKKKSSPAKPARKAVPKSAAGKKSSQGKAAASKAVPKKTAKTIAKRATGVAVHKKPATQIKSSRRSEPKPAASLPTKKPGILAGSAARRKKSGTRLATGGTGLEKPAASAESQSVDPTILSARTTDSKLSTAAARKKSETAVKVESGRLHNSAAGFATRRMSKRPPATPAEPKTATGPVTDEDAASVKPIVKSSNSIFPGTDAKAVGDLKVSAANSAAKKAARASNSAVRQAGRAAPDVASKAARKPVAKPARALIPLPAMTPPAKKEKKLELAIPSLLLEGDYSPGAQPGGPGARYALGLPATPGNESVDDLALPESYGTRNIWLVPRDPQWLYAHWDLDHAQQKEYNQLSRDGHLILRIFDVSAPAEAVTEIHVHPESRSWFAHVGRGGGRYFAVLGFRDKTGDWHEVNRSGPVATPPDSLSEEVEAEFFTQPSAGGPAPAAPVAPKETAPEPVSEFTSLAALEQEPEPKPEPVTGKASIEPEAVAKLIEMLREYVAEEPVLTRAIDEVFDKGGSSKPEKKLELPPPAEFARWTPAQQRALAKVISMDAVREVWAGSNPSSIALAESMPGPREMDLNAIPAQPLGGPPAVGWPGPSAGGISSPHGGVPGERPFWFNVNAELVVYGATEPTARVSIGGRFIRLRGDGTFSYRFALPDGEYQLPITAESADGFEARHASLHFTRSTEYHGDVGAHPHDPRLQAPAPEHTA